MILQYLSSNGWDLVVQFLYSSFNTAAVVLQEEANMLSQDHSNCIPLVRSVRSKIIGGEWEDVEAILRDYFGEV